MLTTAILFCLTQVPTWHTADTIQNGGDKTFTLSGTRAGQRYVLKVRAVCVPTPKWTWRGRQWTDRNHAKVFGADFRVSFNGGDARLIDVGDRKPETTELAFTAPTDDATLRVWDQWEQPKSVPCVVDGLEVSERTS